MESERNKKNEKKLFKNLVISKILRIFVHRNKNNKVLKNIGKKYSQ